MVTLNFTTHEAGRDVGDFTSKVGNDVYHWKAHINHYHRVYSITINGNYINDDTELKNLNEVIPGFSWDLDDHHNIVLRYRPL